MSDALRSDPGTAPGKPFPLTRPQVGMVGLIVSESTFFLTFVVTYLFYIGQSRVPPFPDQVLEVPVVGTVCLLSSSATIALALRALRAGRMRLFLGGWLLTIALGGTFLANTALEWRRLIFDHGLTIATNLFGTSFYSLVGFHAAHVALGLVLLAWYWHFVDAVWVVVATTVYWVGR